MCGINGFTWKETSKIKSMNDALAHRGPDDAGMYESKQLTLGHRRLSIIDLSDAGHQPLFYNKKQGASNAKFKKQHNSKAQYSIIFNGEIYNYIEIREELEKEGYVFTTQTDTEVILASYDKWKDKCVTKFNGMWSFVIHDAKNNSLFCSRDRLGQKPFYYYHYNDVFVFSSELKSLLKGVPIDLATPKHINKEAVELYFSLGFIPSPYTIYKDTYKLPAGHNLTYNLKTNKCIVSQYYEVPKYTPQNNKHLLIQEGRTLLADAVALRMRSDVPVGAFLSGGLDSSSIVSIMKQHTKKEKLHTFSVGFAGKFDESKYAQLAANTFATTHHAEYFDYKDFTNLLDTYNYCYDEPFADYSAYPTYKVSSIARKHVTVSLSGDGGDEIFGGYTRHVTGSQMDIIYKVPRFIRKIISMVPARKNLNTYISFYLLREACKLSLYPKEEFYARALGEEGIQSKTFKKWSIEKMRYCLKKSDNKLGEAMRLFDLLFGTLQDNYLVKVDRASMAHGLEVRSPFLDYRFVAFAQKIPTKHKQDIARTKKLMREIIKGSVPKKIVSRGKQGFTPPLSEWIVQDKYVRQTKSYMNILEKIELKQLHTFFSTKVFKRSNELYKLYAIRLFLFGQWYTEWIEA